jgi:hypothetical protein
MLEAVGAGVFAAPELGQDTQMAFRMGYGVLLLGTLMVALTQGRRFFLSERWGGYAQSARDVDLLQHPASNPLIMAI